MFASLGKGFSVHVPGDGTIAYFGHVQIELNGTLHPVIDAIRGIQQKPVELRVENQIDEAVREYNGRFGALAGTLQVVEGGARAAPPAPICSKSAAS